MRIKLSQNTVPFRGVDTTLIQLTLICDWEQDGNNFVLSRKRGDIEAVSIFGQYSLFSCMPNAPTKP